MIETGIIGYVFILAGSIFVLVRSGVAVVKALVNLARLLHLSEFILSFILMSIATTLPDFSIAINAALAGRPSLAVGNVLGANIVTNGLILGIVAVVAGRIAVNKKATSDDAWLTFALSIAPVILLLDGTLTRFEGVLLLIFFASYIVRLIRLQDVVNHRNALLELGNSSLHLHVKSFFTNLFTFAAGAVLILGSSFFVVDSIAVLSSRLGISGFVFALLALGIGTSLPELTFGLRSVVLKHAGLSLGNLIGAAAFNSSLILGIVALISPIEIAEKNAFLFAAAFMTIIVFFSHLFLRTRSAVSRREGIVLLTIYTIFVILQFII